jgi:RNA polymerase sigma-70 factor, ECF subfamily
MAPDSHAPLEDLSDAEVVANSLSDPHAFGELFERHFDAIFRFLARRVGSDAAQELASDVFLVAFRSRSRFDLRRESALPWLYGIATNLLRNRLRADRRRDEAERGLAVLVSRLPREDPDLALVRLRQDLRTALSRLSERDREVLLLTAWERLSYAAISEALDLPIGTVKSRLHRARQALGEHLDPSGQYRTGGEVS